MIRTFYFHGLPGSALELALFGHSVLSNWKCIDRSGLEGPAALKDRIFQWVQEIDGVAKERPVRIVGFSLGAFVALQVAAKLRATNVSIDLVSPAAPLQSGDFLDELAGRAVFRAAQSSPRLFASLTLAQSLCARAAPGFLAKALFTGAQGEDAQLMTDPIFRDTTYDNLKTGLGAGRKGYLQEISAYIADWSNDLPAIRAPVRIWHGLEDNWAVPGMAASLAEALPNVQAVHYLSGLSHYSTLRYFLQQPTTE